MEQKHNNFLGISCILFDTLSVATLYAIVKFVTKDIASNHIVFLYKTSVFLLALPWMLHKGGIENIKTKYFKIHLLRAFFSVGGSLCFMYGLQFVRLIDATVLQNVEQVLLVAIGLLFFNERVTKTKLMAILFSALGVLVVVRPDLFSPGGLKNFEFNKGYFFVIASIILWVCNNVTIKKLGVKSNSKNQMFYLLLFSVLFTYPVAFIDWGMVKTSLGEIWAPTRIISFSEIGLQWKHIAFVLAMAVCYFSHSLSLFNALKFGELSVVMPFVYFKMVWAGIYGFVIFGTSPRPVSWIGYALIISSGFALMHREVLRKKKVSSEGA